MYSKLRDDDILTFGKDDKRKMTIGGKYVTKYSDTPPPGLYDPERAEAQIRPKSPAVLIREPLKLYQKPASIRPEVNDRGFKPFGADITTKVSMGSKYETKYYCNPSPRDMDYDALMRATKPKSPALAWAPSPSKGGSRMSEYSSPAKYMHTPDPDSIKKMSRQEKIRLLQQLNGGAGPEEMLLNTPSKFTSPAKKKRPMSAVSRSSSALSRGASSARSGKSNSGVKKKKTASKATLPKVEENNLCCLVNQRDRLNSGQVVAYLRKLIETASIVREP